MKLVKLSTAIALLGLTFLNAKAYSSSAKLEYLKKVSSVIIPDVAHGDESFLKDQVEILKKIKFADNEYECLFLEIEPRASISINNFLTGTDYEESVRLWISESSHKIGVPFKNIIPEWYLVKINELGFKIIGVDVDWSSNLGSKMIPAIKLHNQGDTFEKYGKLLVGDRSQVIAENVIHNLQNKSCRKGVLIVGSGHLEDFMFKPIQFYLNNANITGFLW